MSDERITARLPPKLVRALEQAVEDGYYVNRTAAVRDALRLLLGGYMQPGGTEELKRGSPPEYDVRPTGDDRE